MSYFFAFFISADEDDPINIGVKLMLLSRYGTVTHERGRAYGPNKCSGMLIKYLWSYKLHCLFSFHFRPKVDSAVRFCPHCS